METSKKLQFDLLEAIFLKEKITVKNQVILVELEREKFFESLFH